MGNILVCKNDNAIIIVLDGKKLIIDKDNKLFEQLSKLNKEQIKDWYKSRK